MKQFRIVLLVLAAGCGLVSLAGQIFFPVEAGSIGIIGGSDGPTAIFVASTPHPVFIMASILFPLLLILCLVRRLLGRRK